MSPHESGFRRHAAWLGVALLAASGCKLSDVSRDGPAPSITGAARGDAGFPAEAVVCTDLASTITLTGSFSPMPSNTLAGPQGVVLPTVRAVDASGTAVTMTGVTYDQTAGTLSFAVTPQELAPGTYSIEVTNPNGKSTKLTDGLAVVAPPTLTGIDPAFGYTSSPTDVTLTGDGFREAADGTQPTITLTPETATTSAEMVSVAVASATQTTATVPAGLAVDFYGVTFTNPEGCSTTLTHAFEVRPPPVIELCGSVTPAFGWIHGYTTLDICAHNSNGHGLQPVPEAFLLVDPDGSGQNVVKVPLIREQLISEGTSTGDSVMSAVVPSALDARGAGIVVGGPYAIEVINPDGSRGVIPAAFTAVPDPPPVLSSVSPEQATTQQAKTLTITGTNLKDASAGSDLARILLLGTDLAPGGTCAAPGCYVCGSPSAPVVDSNGVATVTCTAPSTTMSAGGYVVRYENTDTWHASGDYAAFTVTNPSVNIAHVTSDRSKPLGTARWDLAGVLGRDDLGNRFEYAIGGLSGDGADTALDSVEVAGLSMFGVLGQWSPMRSKLPSPRSGLVAFVHGRYVFVAGGRDAAGVPQSTVWRAKILGSDSAPTLGAPEALADVSSALVAGTYSYRVSAVMGSGGDNPGGETLASDAESIAVSQGKLVRIAWSAVPGAASYRVYRTAKNGLAYSERLLADGVSTTQFDDDGSGVLDDATAPLPAGALGSWVDMSALAVARAGAAATLAFDPGGVQYVYVTGGADDSGALTNTTDYAPLQVDSSGVVTLGTFATSTPVAGSPLVARAEHIAVTVDSTDTPVIDGNASNYVLVAMGTDGLAARNDIDIAKVLDGGALSDWTETYANSSGSSSNKRQGTLAGLMNSQIVVYGGKSGTTYPTTGISAACTNADPPPFTYSGGSLSVGLTVPRYLGAMLYAGGKYYAIGGRAASALSIAATVDVLTY